jgi:hypothetical protein
VGDGVALRAREVYVATARNCAERAGPLVLIGAVVFVPLGLIDAVANRLHFGEIDQVTDLLGFALVVAALAQGITSLLGEVFYSGAVALLIGRADAEHELSLRRLARSLAYGRLIAVDLLFGLAVAVGAVLLVVPGVIAFTWFALAGPLVELEGVGVRQAFAHSRRLVRGHFFTVLGVLAPIILASELLADVVLRTGHGILGDSLLSDWVVESTTNIALSPLYAVAAVLMTLHLSGARAVAQVVRSPDPSSRPRSRA